MKRLLLIIFCGISLLITHSAHATDNSGQINTLNAQIEQIQKQINEYQQQIETHSAKATTLNAEITKLNTQISKIQLEIKSLGISINQTNLQIGDTQSQINDATEKIELHKAALSHDLRNLYQIDQENLTEILFKNTELSDFFNNLRNLQDAENSLKNVIDNIQKERLDLQEKEAVLEDKKTDLEHLRNLQSAERNDLASTQSTKNQLLKATKGEEARYQKLVTESKQNIERIRGQISNLQQNGVTVEDAIKFGKLTAERVGIRPAFLIAILEVETGLGKNVGTGNWQKDMVQCYLKLKRPDRAETEKAAFLKITAKLGLDPDTVKVSREPNYGCGGAMGPAQFIPSTWLGYEADVAQYTGHNPPNPWNIEDAFMAAAIKLARGGAALKTLAGENKAAKAYISGNGSCTKQICNYYANLAHNKSVIIEQNL